MFLGKSWYQGISVFRQVMAVYRIEVMELIIFYISQKFIHIFKVSYENSCLSVVAIIWKYVALSNKIWKRIRDAHLAPILRAEVNNFLHELVNLIIANQGHFT